MQIRRLLSLFVLAACGAKPAHPSDPGLEQRVKVLEQKLAAREEALAFLDQVYAAQKREAEEKEAEDPDPDAVFAVDLTAPLKAGQVEGPNTALVTIVEAWDFA